MTHRTIVERTGLQNVDLSSANANSLAADTSPSDPAVIHPPRGSTGTAGTLVGNAESQPMHANLDTTTNAAKNSARKRPADGIDEGTAKPYKILKIPGKGWAAMERFYRDKIKGAPPGERTPRLAMQVGTTIPPSTPIRDHDHEDSAFDMHVDTPDLSLAAGLAGPLSSGPPPAAGGIVSSPFLPETSSLIRDTMDRLGKGITPDVEPQVLNHAGPSADSHGPISSRPPSLYALIIAINTYNDAEMDNLSSAVSDARAIQNYLIEELLVPEKNIYMLLDQQATHSNITTYILQRLIHNESIRRGDPIVIYYAGHGTRYAADDTWPTDDGCREAICPCDRGVVRADGTMQNDIADVTLGGYLLQLSEAKGDNITVIMDCCHSGSGTRAGGVPSKSTLRARATAPLSSQSALDRMREEALAVLRHSSLKRNVAPLRVRALDSRTHVLLAACRQDEQAWESDEGGSGLFTSALLDALRNSDLPRLSYAGLMADVGRLHYQTPQCEGRNRDRIIFDGKALGIDKKLVSVRRHGQHGLRVEAGEIHGVVPGTEFAVRSHNFHSADNSYLGHLVASEVHAVWCVAHPKDPAIVIHPNPNKWASVSYWCNLEEPYLLAFSAPDNGSARQAAVVAKLEEIARGELGDTDLHMLRVEDEREANLSVYIDEREMVLERRHPLITEHCHADWTWTRGGARDEWDVLKAVARFDFHLDRENPERPLQNDVTMEVVVLDEQLQPKTTAPIREGVAELLYDPEAEYAVVLHNHSNVDLWCSLYYMDPGEYSAKEIYAPPSATMRPPLRGRSELTLGYGSTGVPPFTFVLKENEKRDTGFLKLFISEHYADLSLIEQNQTFEMVEPENTRGGGGLQGDGQWDTQLTIIKVVRDMGID